MKRRFINSSIHQFRFGLTLVELMVVVTILAIFATSSLIYLASGKRKAQTRDSIRRRDISEIAKAIGFYLTATDTLPGEGKCESSVGSTNYVTGLQCWDAAFTPSDDWDTSADFYTKIITNEQILKKMPKDPKNDIKFHYRYVPSGNSAGLGSTCQSELVPPFWPQCQTYWIGAKLESPSDSTKWVFRCSDMPWLAQGVGCKEIDPDPAPDGDNNCTGQNEDCWQEHPSAT